MKVFGWEWMGMNKYLGKFDNFHSFKFDQSVIEARILPSNERIDMSSANLTVSPVSVDMSIENNSFIRRFTCLAQSPIYKNKKGLSCKKCHWAGFAIMDSLCTVNKKIGPYLNHELDSGAVIPHEFFEKDVGYTELIVKQLSSNEHFIIFGGHVHDLASHLNYSSRRLGLPKSIRIRIDNLRTCYRHPDAICDKLLEDPVILRDTRELPRSALYCFVKLYLKLCTPSGHQEDSKVETEHVPMTGGSVFNELPTCACTCSPSSFDKILAKLQHLDETLKKICAVIDGKASIEFGTA